MSIIKTVFLVSFFLLKFSMIENLTIIFIKYSNNQQYLKNTSKQNNIYSLNFYTKYYKYFFFLIFMVFYIEINKY